MVEITREVAEVLAAATLHGMGECCSVDSYNAGAEALAALRAAIAAHDEAARVVHDGTVGMTGYNSEWTSPDGQSLVRLEPTCDVGTYHVRSYHKGSDREWSRENRGCEHVTDIAARIKGWSKAPA